MHSQNLDSRERKVCFEIAFYRLRSHAIACDRIVITCNKCNKCDTCDKCDIACNATNLILITHAILHRLSRSHLLLGVRRIDDLNNTARAAPTPLLGDDDAAVDYDGNVEDVTWPVLVIAINTMDGNAASRDSKMVGWWDDRRAIGVVDALDSGEGRGMASPMATMLMGGPGADNVEVVNRFRRAGRR